MEDEYGIKGILERNNIDAETVLPLLNDKFNLVCGNYMNERKGDKKSAFTEVKCHLLQALIKTEDNDQLKKEIEIIIEAL